VLTLEEVVRITAEVAGLRCSIVRLPDFVAFAQAVVMNFLPGKPFSVDNYKSLTIDAICREDGCARLGIKPQPMLAVLPTYLGETSTRALRG
jgi:NADH dehydrogenase